MHSKTKEERDTALTKKMEELIEKAVEDDRPNGKYGNDFHISFTNAKRLIFELSVNLSKHIVLISYCFTLKVTNMAKNKRYILRSGYKSIDEVSEKHTIRTRK